MQSVSCRATKRSTRHRISPCETPMRTRRSRAVASTAPRGLGAPPGVLIGASHQRSNRERISSISEPRQCMESLRQRVFHPCRKHGGRGISRNSAKDGELGEDARRPITKCQVGFAQSSAICRLEREKVPQCDGVATYVGEVQGRGPVDWRSRSAVCAESGHRRTVWYAAISHRTRHRPKRCRSPTFQSSLRRPRSQSRCLRSSSVGRNRRCDPAIKACWRHGVERGSTACTYGGANAESRAMDQSKASRLDVGCR